MHLQKLVPLQEVRGRGLLQGVVFDIDAKSIATKCIEIGLISICTNDYVLRFMPPLNITKDHVDEAYDIVEKSIAEVA